MTAAGFNHVGRVWEYSYPQDDAIGGSVPSGTVIHDFVQMRIVGITPTMALLEQGVETTHLYRCMASAHAFNLRENHEIEVYLPIDSPYFNVRFRVISEPKHSIKPNDPRDKVSFIMRRADIAHVTNESW